jgi:hypothetical protein
MSREDTLRQYTVKSKQRVSHLQDGDERDRLSVLTALLIPLPAYLSRRLAVLAVLGACETALYSDELFLLQTVLGNTPTGNTQQQPPQYRQ